MSFRNLLKRAAQTFFSDKPGAEPDRAGIFRPTTATPPPGSGGNRRRRRAVASLRRRALRSQMRKLARAKRFLPPGIRYASDRDCLICGDPRRIAGRCLPCSWRELDEKGLSS